MDKHKSNILILSFFLASTAAASPADEAKAKNAIAMIDYVGTTAGAFYTLYKADQELKVPGSEFQQLARRVSYELETGKAASALTRAPFDLTADTLAAAALVNPEPTTKIVAAISSYGSRKIGEAAANAVYKASEDKALGILSRGLKESGYTAAQLDAMTPAQFQNAVESMRIGGQELRTILDGKPEALAMIKAHAEDIRASIGEAALLQAKQTDATVNEIRDTVVKTEQNLSDFRKETQKSLNAVEGALEDLNRKALAAGESLDALRKEVGSNTRTLNSLAQISSMSWTTEQKISALSLGMFPELDDVEKGKMIDTLNKQLEVEKSVKNLQSAAADVGKLASIAGNLGVDKDVVLAMQGGQLLLSGAAQYFAGDYLGAAASVTSLTGLGKPDAAAQRHAQLMSYLEKRFDAIDKKLDEIKDLQIQTLKSLYAMSQQLSAIDTRLASVEKAVLTSHAALQFILREEFRTCDAIANSTNGSIMIDDLQVLEQVLVDGTKRQQLMDCYKTYSNYIDGVVLNASWAGGQLSQTVFPDIDIIDDPETAKISNDFAKKENDAYTAARGFLLKANPDAATKPAAALIRLADPKWSVTEAEAREQLLAAAQPQLDGFRCNDVSAMHSALLTLICQGQANRAKAPLKDRFWTLVSPSKLGLQSLRLIDTGMILASFADFTYADKESNNNYTVPFNDLMLAPAQGFSKAMADAKAQKRGEGTLNRVEWLAYAYLLQQSMLYGDATVQAIVKTLYDEPTKALRTTYGGATDLQRLALNAMSLNPTLARNVVMQAMRKAMMAEVTMADGVKITVPSYSFYAQGLNIFRGARACERDDLVTHDLSVALPHWPIALRASEADKKIAKQTNDAAISLDACNGGDLKSDISTGIVVVFEGFDVKAPSPRSIETGEYEMHPGLRVAISYVNQVADAKSMRQLAKALPDSNADKGELARALIASGCLRGEISCTTL